MAGVLRSRGPAPGRVDDVATDRQLQNHEQRIVELGRRVQALERATVPARIGMTFLAKSLNVVGDRIRLDGAKTPLIIVEIALPSGALTLTSTPNIEQGAFDGQILVLRRTASGATLTIRNETSLAGAGLRLDGAADKGLTSRDSIGLIWRASTLEWWQVIPLVAN